MVGAKYQQRLVIILRSIRRQNQFLQCSSVSSSYSFSDSGSEDEGEGEWDALGRLGYPYHRKYHCLLRVVPFTG